MEAREYEKTLLDAFTISLLQELLKSEAEHYSLHQFHVDEPWVLLLDVL